MAASAVGDAPVVRVEALDGVLNGAAVTVLKMDVEGHERAVLRGASRALGERQIRHVIFEDHQPQPSDVVRDLQSAGYQVLSLGWSIRGPIVRLVETAGLAKEFEAPNFIAATHSEDLIARCSPPGWRVRRRRFSSRRIRR